MNAASAEPDVVEVSVSKDDCIQLAAFDLRLAAVLRSFLLAALKEATVDENAGFFSDHLICGPGYVTGCAKEAYFHNSPSIARLCATSVFSVSLWLTNSKQ